MLVFLSCYLGHVADEADSLKKLHLDAFCEPNLQDTSALLIITLLGI